MPSPINTPNPVSLSGDIASTSAQGAQQTDQAQLGGGVSGVNSAYAGRGYSPAQLANHSDIREMLKGDYDTYRNGANAGAIDNVVTTRAESLAFEFGHSRADVENNLAKAQKLDWISATAAGTLTATPFVVSGFLAKVLNDKMLSGLPAGGYSQEALAALIGNATAMELKAIGDKIFEPATTDALWLAPDESKMDPALKNAFNTKQSIHQEAWKSALGGLGYTLRNAIVGLLAAAKNPQLSQAANLILTATAGSLGGAITHSYDVKHQPQGLQCLLARDDWKERYRQLNDTPVYNQLIGGTVRRSGEVVSGLLTMGLEGGRNALTAKALADASILGAGGSISTVIVKALMSIKDASVDSRGMAVVAGLLSALFNAPVYAIQGAGGVYLGHLADKSTSAVRKAITSGSSSLGDGAVATADRAGRLPHATGAAVGNMTARAGEIYHTGHEAVSNFSHHLPTVGQLIQIGTGDDNVIIDNPDVANAFTSAYRSMASHLPAELRSRVIPMRDVPHDEMIPLTAISRSNTDDTAHDAGDMV
ncbi:hypothetical protein [Sodalis sp. dw_96]|uniref:hypothetical protein n=1 Tax=Sodalis sp. dw_96 TaxID=2719794 RepID=UPI001BD384E1|nr:hypothetical protein [Sodalis sp. dw_96]